MTPGTQALADGLSPGLPCPTPLLNQNPTAFLLCSNPLLLPSNLAQEIPHPQQDPWVLPKATLAHTCHF